MFPRLATLQLPLSLCWLCHLLLLLIPGGRRGACVGLRERQQALNRRRTPGCWPSSNPKQASGTYSSYIYEGVRESGLSTRLSQPLPTLPCIWAAWLLQDEVQGFVCGLAGSEAEFSDCRSRPNLPHTCFSSYLPPCGRPVCLLPAHKKHQDLCCS